MPPLVRHLDKIKELRFEHSRRFAAMDFSTMPQLDTKIKLAWADYQIAKNLAANRMKCFNCCGPMDPNFTVEKPGDTPLFFCSAACRQAFGVSLGLT